MKRALLCGEGSVVWKGDLCVELGSVVLMGDPLFGRGICCVEGGYDVWNGDLLCVDQRIRF